jgi:hypothetical protein
MSLLPGLTQSAPGVPIFAPASGGGGGGGANLNISTMAVNPNGEILFPNSGTQNGQIIGFTDTANNSTTTLSVTFPTGYVGANSNTGLWTIENLDNFNSLYYGDFCAGKFVVAGNNSGASGQLPYITAGTNGDMTIVGAASVNISTPSLLQNGVPIGGGGSSGGIAVSSITSFPGDATSTITMAPGAAGQVVISGAPLSGGNDISFETSIPGNSVSQNYQPGADANAIIMRNPGNTNGGLNLAALTAGGAVIAAAAGATGSPSTLTITSDSANFLQPIALGASLNIYANDPNLYAINCVSSSVALAGMSIGLVGGRYQVYADTGEVPNFFTSTIKGTTGQISLNPSGTEQIRIGGTGAPGDITIATVGGGDINLQGDVVVSSGLFNVGGAGTISSLSVSSINGAAPGGGLTNFTVPFITGSGDGTTWTANVDSNTGGLAVQLTSTLITNSANSYLVSYSLVGGSNSDTSQYTKLSVYTAGGNPTIQTCPGLVSNNWLSNGFMGARSLIVSGAAAIRLEAENYSATVSTLLYFDQGTLFKVTNLGASS